MTEQPLDPLNRLVSTWTTEATHPASPGLVVAGSAVIEWLEGEQFLLHRATTDHPDFPDSTSIIGITDQDRVGDEPAPDPGAGPSGLTMHYFDSRGVFRVYEVSLDDEAWRIWRDAPGFSQRFTGTFDARGDTVEGLWQMCTDDVNWHDDLQITYRRER